VEVLGDPSVDYFSPGLGDAGDTILVIGQNFSKTAKNNVVKFGLADAAAFQCTAHPAPAADSLKVVVPAGASSAPLRLKVYSKQAISKDTFYVTTGKWIKRASLPGCGRFNGVAFAVCDKGYVGLGTGDGISPANERNDLWEYDPTADTWTQKANYPNGTLKKCTSFVINGKAYVGFGTQTTLSYLNNYSL